MSKPTWLRKPLIKGAKRVTYGHSLGICTGIISSHAITRGFDSLLSVLIWVVLSILTVYALAYLERCFNKKMPE